MNVYDHISENNRKIVFILFVFPLALFVMLYLVALSGVSIGLVWLLEALFHGYAFNDHVTPLGFFDRLTETGRLRQAWRLTMGSYPWIFGAAFVWIVISYFTGGAMILRSARARSVTFEENRELFRLVQNTAIMGGLPTPKIYLIEDNSLNAFATGCSPQTATIALTRGIVEKLDKDELQAVIAHELAHIGNYDTRLMTIVIAGIGCFTFLGENLCNAIPDAFTSEKVREDRLGLAMSGVVFLIIYVISLFFGIAFLVFGYVVAPIIRSALSRRQEFQADATAAKIIRDPDALARALTKIAPDSRVMHIDRCPLVGNICIANPARPGCSSSLENRLYATHPPIEERIAALKNMMGKNVIPPIPAGKAVW